MVTELNANEWDESLRNADKPLVVEFWHEQCMWCKKLAPVYEELEKSYPNANFARLNVLASEENSAIGEKYGIMGTPTTKVFCKGMPVGEIVGFMGKEALKSELDRILQNSDSCLKSTTPIKK
ncbi:MAG: thioredoxin family protein [Rhabdochlamydiaceae bacterium]